MSGRLSGAVRALRRSTDGIAAVEFALIAPVFLLFVLGSTEFARAFWTWNTMLFAVEQAGRYAAVNYSVTRTHSDGTNFCGDFSATAVQNYALTQLPGIGSVTVTASAPTCTASPPTTTITATYTFTFVATGLLPFGPLTLTQTATVQLL